MCIATADVLRHSDEIEELRNHVAFDLSVEGTVRGQGRGQVHLQQPGLEVFRKENIKTKQLEKYI